MATLENPSDHSNPQAPQNRSGRNSNLNRWLSAVLNYLVPLLILLWLLRGLLLPSESVNVLPYSEFKQQLASGQVSEVAISDSQILGTLKAPGATGQKTPTPAPIPFVTYTQSGADPGLVQELQLHGVKYSFEPAGSPWWGLLLSWLVPIGLMGVFYYFMFRRMGGTGAGGLGNIFGVGKSKALEVRPEQVKVTFKDVGGADEAIAELQEIIQFLKEPKRFARLGGRIPKGVLLLGSPGTGKTLLAKATAGEAGVAFFETSGSEFVEMFVGVGAARVRDLFEQARKAAPAIVFIDEIDAIGQSRGGVRMVTNEEREQTLNQLLGEIDGFKTDTDNPVILMAATNRPEVLDPALLRAGRFDRQITVEIPDLIGRKQILHIHTRGIQLSSDFDLDQAARLTPGFTGADLANVMNEAALLAARHQEEAVTMADFEAAIERVVAGLERKTRRMNDLERSTVAYHECGHALVAQLLPHADPVAKVSIIPRGRAALGYTLQMPTEDRYLLTVDELEDRLAVMLGGRAAEVVVFGVVSTGASDDIQRATELARRMVTEFGMSPELGSVRYASQGLQYLAGNQEYAPISPETQERIDQEIRRMVNEQYARAQDLLKQHRPALESLAKDLLNHETLDGSAVKQVLAVETTHIDPEAPRTVPPSPAQTRDKV